MNGDGYLDIVAKKPSNPNGLFFEDLLLVEASGTPHRYSSLSSRVWIQQPKAATGQPRWIESDELAIPFAHVGLSHWYGENPIDPILGNSVGGIPYCAKTRPTQNYFEVEWLIVCRRQRYAPI